MLGVQIDALTWHEAVDRLLGWARARQSRYVAISNVHVVVSATRDAMYRLVIDGAPVAWMLRKLGFAGQPRISGPDLMWALCERCAAEQLPGCRSSGPPLSHTGSLEKAPLVMVKKWFNHGPVLSDRRLR